MNTKKFYDSTASKYDERHTNHMLRHMRKTEEKLIKHYTSGRILDIGCGTGQHLRPNSIGLDISMQMLKEAGKKGFSKLVQADAEHLPFKANSFDSIICIFTVLNLCEFSKVINEIKRLLKKDGMLIVSVTSVWERGNKKLIKKLFARQYPCNKKFRIEGFRLKFHAFTKDEFLAIFKKDFILLKFMGMFIAQNPWWGWHRSFSLREKMALRLDHLQFLNRNARLYLAVFRKR